MSGNTLDDAQRRLLFGICLIVGAITFVPATYNFVIHPMLEGLGASESQSSLLRQLPSTAALLVIFLAGVLGNRWGERRVITICAIGYTVGTAVVTVAPGLPVAVVGLVLQGATGSALVVIALGLLSRRISNSKARASAFATFALAAPVVFGILPVVAGYLLDSASWRWIPAIWTLGGLVMIWSSQRLLPHDTAVRGSGELITPALAGLVLASGVQMISAVANDGWASPSVLVRATIMIVALVGLVVVYRRGAAPSLSLAALRHGGILILLTVAILIPFAYLFFYLTVGYQYVFGLDTLQTAIAMTPGQVAAIVGALVTRKILQRLGITVTGVTLLLALAGSLLLALFVESDSPLWVPILVSCFYGAAVTGVSIPLTNSIMNTAPAGDEGSTSAFRSAAFNVGSALGVVVMSTIVFASVSTTLSTILADEGMKSQESTTIAESMRSGVTSEQVASDYSVPVAQVNEISTAQGEAMVAGLHTLAVTGSIIAGACVVFFAVGRWRQGRVVSAG